MSRKRLNSGPDLRTMTMTKIVSSSRQQRKTFSIIGMAGCFGLFMVLMQLALSYPVLAWVSLAPALASVVFACLWISALDEVARQTHYRAWSWGGSIGLMVSLFTFLWLALQPGLFDRAIGALGVAEPAMVGLGAGLMLAFVPASLGYFIWWAVAWLRRG